MGVKVFYSGQDLMTADPILRKFGDDEVISTTIISKKFNSDEG